MAPLALASGVFARGYSMLNVFGRRLRYGISVAALMAGTQAALLLNAYGGEGMAMVFSGAETSIKIVDSTTPSNDWDSAWGDGYSVQDFFKSRSFTSYTGPVSSGKRLMQADGYIKPCRHNLLPMSNRFGSGAWTRTAVTSTYGQTDADGGSTASLITESNTATSVLYTTTAFTTAANVPYTISVKIKKGNSTWVRLAFGTSGGTFTNGVQQWYNLDTVATGTAATTGTASHIASTITADTNSYYILTLTASQASTTGAFIVSTATADASATRTTSGTYYICHAMCNAGSQALDYVSSEAHNICLQSQTFQTTWTRGGLLAFGAGSTVDETTSPDGTATADLQTEDTSTGDHRTYQSISVISGLIYTFSCYLKPNGRTLVTLYNNAGISIDCTFNISSGTVTNQVAGTASIESVGNGWYRCSVVNTASSTATGNYQIRLVSTGTTTSYTGDGVSGVYMWGAQVELSSSPGKYVATTAAAVYNQHFDLPVEYNTDGTVKALTREEARTNLLTYNNFQSTGSTWGVQASAVLTPGTTTGPDGVANSAATLALGMEAVTACFKTSSPISGAGTYTVSVWAKGASGGEAFNIIVYNGTDGEQDGPTETLTTTWTRYSATFTVTAATNTYFGRAAGGPASTVYVWGSQCESGSTVSSVIMTGSATVTRAVDDIYVATTVFPHSATEWTVYQKMTQDYLVSFAAPYSLSNETTAERHDTYLSAAGAVVARTTDGGADQASITPSGTISAATAFKFASAVKVNDFAACLNGGTVGADVSGTVPTVYRFRLGGGQSNGSPMHGGVHESMYVPTRLADATLQTLTTA